MENERKKGMKVYTVKGGGNRAREPGRKTERRREREEEERISERQTEAERVSPHTNSNSCPSAASIHLLYATFQ